MRSLTHWLLSGALAASLLWNLEGLRPAPEPRTPACADGAFCAPAGASGAPAPACAELNELCARSCREADRLEAQADELQRRLLDGLAAETPDEAELARLADEIGELRRRSLAACVQGVLELRRVVSREQVRALLAACPQADRP